MNEWEEIPLPICTCGQVGAAPVDKGTENSADATSFEKAKAFSFDQSVVDALVDAVDLLGARIEALEMQYASFLGVLDRPLSPAESLEELKRLREELI